MALIEKVFINHHIEMHDDCGRISIRLIDESCGPGELVDESGVIKLVDNYCMIPLKSGGSTPTSPEAAIYILSKLSIPVEKNDDWGENPIVIDHFFLPESDEERLALITADRASMIEVEREIEHRERATPPEWYTTLKRLRSTEMRSLFR